MKVKLVSGVSFWFFSELSDSLGNKGHPSFIILIMITPHRLSHPPPAPAPPLSLFTNILKPSLSTTLCHTQGQSQRAPSSEGSQPSALFSNLLQMCPFLGCEVDWAMKVRAGILQNGKSWAREERRALSMCGGGGMVSLKQILGVDVDMSLGSKGWCGSWT